MSFSRVAVFGLLLCLPTFAEVTPDAKPPAVARPVDYTKLQEFLPIQLAGLPLSDASARIIETGDFTLSMATAHYTEGTGDAPPTAGVTIADYAAASALAERMTAWSKVEIDQESESQHQHTLTIAGHPAIMTYMKQDQSAQVQVWVGHRYLIQVSTTNLPEHLARKAAESLPYDKVQTLK